MPPGLWLLPCFLFLALLLAHSDEMHLDCHAVSCPSERPTRQQLTANSQQATEALSPPRAKTPVLPRTVKCELGTAASWLRPEKCWTTSKYFIHRNGDVTDVCYFKQQQKISLSHPTMKSWGANPQWYGHSLHAAILFYSSLCPRNWLQGHDARHTVGAQ